MALPRPLAKLVPMRPLTCMLRPSPAWVKPVWPLTSSPSKSSRILKLTTPAMASAPYTAAAPPVMTSTFFTAADGMVFTSTTSWALTGCARRPLTSTSVRLVPRPRRLSVAAPGASRAPENAVAALLCADAEPAVANCGRSFRASSTFGAARFSNTSWLTVTIGLLAWRSRRAMREPVMMMACSSPLGAAAALS